MLLVHKIMQSHNYTDLEINTVECVSKESLSKNRTRKTKSSGAQKSPNSFVTDENIHKILERNYIMRDIIITSCKTAIRFNPELKSLNFGELCKNAIHALTLIQTIPEIDSVPLNNDLVVSSISPFVSEPLPPTSFVQDSYLTDENPKIVSRPRESITDKKLTGYQTRQFTRSAFGIPKMHIGTSATAAAAAAGGGKRTRKHRTKMFFAKNHI